MDKSKLKVIADDMLPVLENEIGEKFVDARKLHEKLMVGKVFAAWVTQRIDQYGFIENEDFFPFLEKSNGGRPRQEYLFTIDAGKELAMVEHNEMGRAVRKYFIQVEKQSRQSSKRPKTNAEMFMMAAEQLLSQEKRINRLESNLAAAHSRIDNLDKIDTIGDLQQRLNKMVRLYAQHDGLTYQQAWRNFRQSFNTAYRENLTLRIENYKMNHHIKALSMPQYLSKVGRLDDAIRVADKLLNQRSEVI